MKVVITEKVSSCVAFYREGIAVPWVALLSESFTASRDREAIEAVYREYSIEDCSLGCSTELRRLHLLARTVGSSERRLKGVKLRKHLPD